MTATGELRHMLDERGVEYDTGETVDGEAVATFWYDREGYPCSAIEGADDIPDGEISMQACVTTEQAIDVTLGRGTCHIVKTWSDSDYDEDWRYRCSECGCFIGVYERDPETGDVISADNYCPSCGRKVVDE